MMNAMIEKSKHDAAERQIYVMQTIIEMVNQGDLITYTSVANKCGVSRQYLYRHPEIKQLIDECRISGMSKSELQREVVILRLRLMEAGQGIR